MCPEGKPKLAGALALVAVVLVGGVGCGGADSKRELAEFYTQRIIWGSCSGFAGGDKLGPEVECAKVLVPIDYDKPNGTTGQVAISRLRARGDRVGSIVVNPGGPGASGLDKADTLGKTALGERFDVVGFDLRGSGASTPKIECLTLSETATLRPDDYQTDWSPSGVETVERNNRDYVDKCVERSGTELLGHVGTREVARDLDVIRAVLGEEKLTYLGYSYGARLGSTYAEAFPRNVRAMVLDSGVPLDGPVADLVKFYASLQQAFDTYARDCAENVDCPVEADPSRASHVLQRLLNPLIGQPIPVGTRTLTYSGAVTAIVAALYNPAGWSTITSGLQQLRSGRGDILLDAAETVPGIVDTTVQTAVFCLDDPRTTDRAAAAARQERMFAAAPFLNDGNFKGQAPLDKCAFWPTPPTGTPHTFSVSGLPPMVVVAATGDPAAPYDGNQKLAHQLNSPLITYRGTQHGVFLLSGSTCVDAPVLNYLTELTPPADGLLCQPA